MVAEPEVNPGAATHRREADDTGVLQHRPGLAPPRDDLVGGLLRQYGIPFDGDSAGSTDSPVGMSVAAVLHLPDVRHEKRKVLVVGPETVDLFDRRVDEERLLNIHCPAPIV